MSMKKKAFAKFKVCVTWVLVAMLVLTNMGLPIQAEERQQGGFGEQWTGPVPLANDGVLNVDNSVGWRLGGTSYGQDGVKTINGDVVYCLERLKMCYHGTPYIGIEEDFSSVGISHDQKLKLSLLAYFGKKRAEETVRLTDTNGVLSTFKITNSSGLNERIEGNVWNYQEYII